MSETRTYYIKSLTVMNQAVKKLLTSGYRLDDVRQMNVNVIEGQAGVVFPDKPAGLPPISVEMYLNSEWHRELIEQDDEE